MIYLSIVIPVRNEESFINGTLQMLAEQRYPKDRYEILVVDGCSTDGTCDKVNDFILLHPELNLRLLHNPGRLSSRGRNMGAREARGRFIAVIDGHVHIPGDRLLEAMEELKEENDALCLARPAPLDVPGLDSGLSYWIAVARKSWLGHSRVSFIYSDFEGFVDAMSSGFAYDRACFDRVGFFDEAFDAAEDVEFHFRLKQAGIRAYTSPRLLIYSYPRSSFRALFNQQMRYGIGRARLIRKHPGGFSKETPIPAAIFLFFISFPLAAVVSFHAPLLGIAYWGLLFFYSMILLTTGFKEAIARRRFFPGISVALAIWVTHIGLGWGLLKEFCFRSGSAGSPPRQAEADEERH